MAATDLVKQESELIEDVELKPVPTNARARLDPRPSEDEKDPLNWPLNLKLFILFQVCWLACVSKLPRCRQTLAMPADLF